MSNPTVLTLVDGKLANGQHLRIEDNFGESIHIHIGEITFYLTISEFEDLAKSFLDAGRELFAERGLSFDDIDISALDWGWLKKYRQITSIQKKEISIKDLYTIDKLSKKGLDIWRYVKVNESKNFKALSGDHEVLARYNEFCLYGQNSESRLYDLLDLIKEKGYPFDNKYIIVNQFGVMYDGAHRAAILAYLYGLDTKIPVLEISFRDEPPVDEYNKSVYRQWKRKKRKKTISYFRSAVSYLLKRKWHNKQKPQKKNSFLPKEEHHSNNICFAEFTEFVKKTNIPHFYIEKSKIDKHCQKIADATLVVDKSHFVELRKQLEKDSVLGNRISCYDKYNMLYSLDKPYIYQLKDICVIVCSQMFIKSLFFDALLPVDSYIICQAWKTIIHNDKPLACQDIVIVMTILDAVFDQGLFTENDRIYLKNNKERLATTNIKAMLKTEFFNYTDDVINLLIHERFDEIIPAYFQFREY